jgi:hypothetical protein
MRACLAFVLVLVTACGGSVATIPDGTSKSSGSSGSSGGGGGGSRTPPAPTPTVGADPGDPGLPPPPPAVACGTSGTPTNFANVYVQASALDGAWDVCTNPICPASDPHLFFDSKNISAACGRWCGSDGGFCASSDPRYVFMTDVSGTYESGFVLTLANQTDVKPASYKIRYWHVDPFSTLELTAESGTVTTLQGVGIPVK